MNINILEQLEIDEAKAQSDVASLEKQLALRKNDLVEIGIAMKRCAPYLTTESVNKPIEAIVGEHEDANPIRRRSLGEIKRKVLEGYFSKRDEFLTNQEVASITGMSLEQVKAVTLDSKKRNELLGGEFAGVYKAKITQHGIDRLKESKENDAA